MIGRSSIALASALLLIFQILTLASPPASAQTSYYKVYLQSRADDGSWANEGTITVQNRDVPRLPWELFEAGGTKLTIWASNPKVNGVEYKFDRWETSGGISISDRYSLQPTLTINGEGTLEMVAKSDLKEIKLDVSPSYISVKPGETATYTATVTATKIGEGEAFYLYTQVSDRPPESTHGYGGEQYVNSQKKTTTILININTGSTPAGTYTMDITVGVSGMESVKDTKQVQLEVLTETCPPKCPDLAISNVNWSPESPKGGQTVTFTYTEINQGNDKALAHRVSLWIDGQLVSSDDVPELAAGESRTRTFPQAWTAVSGSHEVKVKVDSNDGVIESDEDNNFFIEQIGGEKAEVDTDLTLELDPSGANEKTKTYVTMSGRLTREDSGEGLDDMPIKLKWTGGMTTVTTDSDGYYIYSTQVGPYDEGSVTFTAYFAGDETYDEVLESDSSSEKLVIGTADMIETSLDLQVCPASGRGYDCSLSSIDADIETRIMMKGSLIREDSGNGISDKVVHLEWTDGSFDAMTASNGEFELIATMSLSEGSHTFTASFSGDDEFEESSDSKRLSAIGEVIPTESSASIISLYTDSEEYFVGDTVEIFYTVENTGDASLRLMLVVDIKDPDDKYAYNSNSEGEDEELILQIGEQQSGRFSWTIPTSAKEGTYRVEASIRDWNDWDTVYDCICGIQEAATFEIMVSDMPTVEDEIFTNIIGYMKYDDTYELRPLEGVKVELSSGFFSSYEDYTDSNGKYEFHDVPVNAETEKNLFTIKVELTDDRYVKVRYDDSIRLLSGIVGIELEDVRLLPEKEVILEDIVFYDEREAGAARIYQLTREIAKFYAEQLDVDVDIVDVFVFSTRTESAYYGELLRLYGIEIPITHDIVVSEGYSSVSYEHTPDVIAMEYTHYVQHILFDGLHVRSGDSNHQGFSNPSTADSWIEGLGTFMALPIKDIEGREGATFFAGSNIENNIVVNDDSYDVLDPITYEKIYSLAEELAIAGILWDLYDGTDTVDDSRGTDDESVDLSLDELWEIITTKKEFPTYYDALGRQVDEDISSERHIFYLKDLYEVLSEYDVDHDGKVDDEDQILVDEIFELHGAPLGLTDPSRPDRV